MVILNRYSRLFRGRNSCRCFCVEVVKLLPVRQYTVELIFFHILVLQEYWVLVESRIPLKQVLEGVNIFALSVSSHAQTQ